MRSSGKLIHTSILLVVFCLTVLSLTGCQSGGGESAQGEEAAFNERFDSAWAEIRNHWKLVREGKAQEEDDPQKTYAEEFFAYYVKHSHTKTGQKALRGAFMMWGNLADLKNVEMAVPKIDTDSEVWPSLLPGIQNAYFVNKKSDEFIELLHELESKLTHPASRTAVFYELAQYYQKAADTIETAKKYLEKIVALQASAFYVEKAKGDLYELDSLNIGQIAPDFSAEDIDGKDITLSALRGKVVLLDFWATWCGPCIPEIPYIKRIHSDYQNDGFVLLGISLDRNLEELKRFVTTEEMEWPQIIQSQKWEGAIVRQYNITGIPSTYTSLIATGE